MKFNKQRYSLIIILILFSCTEYITQCVEVNTGTVQQHRGKQPVKISDFFGIDDGYTTFDEYPRLICDIDGDGNNDIVGFSSTGVMVSFSDGTNFANPTKISDDFTITAGYTNQQSFPRFCGDVDGDGKDDIVGIQNDGVYVSFSTGQTDLEPAQRLSTEFCSSGGGWTTQTIHPRFLVDVDGDGKADMIGCDDSGVLLAFSNGKDTGGVAQNFDTGFRAHTQYGRLAGGWSSDMVHKRYPAHIRHSDKMDFMGFTTIAHFTFFVDTSTGFQPWYTSLGSNLVNSQYPNWNTEPRMVGDINGDGFSDMIGFDNDQIKYSLIVSEIAQPVVNYISAGIFVLDGGEYVSQDTTPRFVENILGDHRDDIIGFSSNGVYVLETGEVCTDNESRDGTNSCACKTGYREDPSAPNGPCLPCVYPCRTCENSDTNCLECINTVANRNLASDCHCEQGYYNTALNNCEICDDGCEACSTSSSQCSSCKNGYFHTPPNTCTKCADGCTLCSTAADQCSECKPGGFRNPIPGDCSCTDGYYHDSNIDCVQCKNKYAKCSGENSVIECKGQFRENESQDCVCSDGYFEVLADNQTDCTKCNDECTKCENSASECTECIAGPNRKVAPSDCTCLDSFYENSSQQCVKCKNKYAKCSAENTAVECQGQFRENELQNCICQNGYFEVIADNQTDCTRCNDECAQCQNTANYCTQCIAGGNRKPAPSDCTCQDSYYENSSQECVKCKNKYAKCSDLNTAIECQGLFRENKDLDCVCQTGYFEVIADNQLNCTQCNNLCRTCDESGCTECSNIDPNRNPTTCECNIGYYADGSQCKKCSRSCFSCDTSATDCIISCDSSCALCDETGNCTSCPLTKYLNSSGTCTSCHPKCEICSDSSTCTQCSGNGLGRSKTPDDNCGCLEGYYENGNNLDCLQCPSGCKRCNNTGTCEECVNSDFMPPLCEKQKKGIFLDISNPSLPVTGTCDLKCNKCENSPSNCTQCSLGLFRDLQSPCNCMEGYHDNQGSIMNCQKCPKLCKTCISENRCTECEAIENLDMNSLTGKCECKRGYLMNKQGICQKCYTYRDSCYIKCPENTILSEEYQTCLGLQYSISDNISIFWVCSISLLAVYIAKIIFGIIIVKRRTSQSNQIEEQNNDNIRQEQNNNSNNNNSNKEKEEQNDSIEQ